MDPESLAEEVVRDYFGGTSFPICPFKLCDQSGILVRQLPPGPDGVSGMLMRVGSEFAIAYAAHLRNDGFERFCVAHELGHYFLPSHPEKVFSVSEIHQSAAGFKSNSSVEREADRFGASFLMPRSLMNPAIESLRQESVLDCIDQVRDQARTSLTATAIRVAECYPEPVAVIVSQNRKVQYFAQSRDLKDHSFGWPVRFVPTGSPTSSLGKQGRAEGAADLSDWFEKAPAIEAWEEAVALGSYGRILTVVHAPDLPTPEELEEDEELTEKWTPRFRR